MNKELFEIGLQIRREVLLQTAIFYGVAAAADSFRLAREVFSEINHRDSDYRIFHLKMEFLTGSIQTGFRNLGTDL